MINNCRSELKLTPSALKDEEKNWVAFGRGSFSESDSDDDVDAQLEKEDRAVGFGPLNNDGSSEEELEDDD